MTHTSMTLYQRVLKDEFSLLHPMLQRFHASHYGGGGRGPFEVIRGTNVFSRLMGLMMGLPPAAKHVEVVLDVETRQGDEYWSRTFGDWPMHSRQRERAGLLLEYSGPACVGFRLSVEDGELVFTSKRAWLLGIRLPSFFVPIVHVKTNVGENGWQLDARIDVRWIGLLIHYKGFIRVEPKLADASKEK